MEAQGRYLAILMCKNVHGLVSTALNHIFPCHFTATMTMGRPECWIMSASLIIGEVVDRQWQNRGRCLTQLCVRALPMFYFGLVL